MCVGSRCQADETVTRSSHAQSRSRFFAGGFSVSLHAVVAERMTRELHPRKRFAARIVFALAFAATAALAAIQFTRSGDRVAWIIFVVGTLGLVGGIHIAVRAKNKDDE